MTFIDISDSTSAIVKNEVAQPEQIWQARYTDEPVACRECGHSVVGIHFTGCSEL
jgi:hypothetical protein